MPVSRVVPNEIVDDPGQAVCAGYLGCGVGTLETQADYGRSRSILRAMDEGRARAELRRLLEVGCGLLAKKSVPPILCAWKRAAGSVCPALGTKDSGSTPKSGAIVGLVRDGAGGSEGGRAATSSVVDASRTASNQDNWRLGEEKKGRRLTSTIGPLLIDMVFLNGEAETGENRQV
jgi:hypothetical protein